MKDLTGMRFGRYVVLGFHERKKSAYYWSCQCDCGNIRQVRAANLRNGHSQSCGCLSVEMSTERLVKATKKHGLKNHPLYATRMKMITRCNNPSHDSYPYYGGRGIKVCPEWMDAENGFPNFYEWALENGWKKSLSIERIDVNGNYEPSNCTWITMAQQQRNKRNVVQLEYQGRTMSIAEWANELGIPKQTLWGRIQRYGWPIDKAFSVKPHRGHLYA